jgi:AcrR family transcriptional regulator
LPKPRHQSAAGRKPNANGHTALRDLTSLRRGQVVAAAAAVIAERGVQGLSLSAVERRAGMSRGQLTYYFPTKEDILLAVFDHTVDLMRQRAGQSPEFCAATPEERITNIFRFVLTRPPEDQFSSLMHTFLAQTSHREDFRGRLANLFEEWRAHMASDLAGPRGGGPGPRAAAILVQALLHGLAVQRAADPAVVEAAGLTDLCQQVVAFLQAAASQTVPTTTRRAPRRPRTADEGDRHD